MTKLNAAVILVCVVPMGSCFVSPGDCVQAGVTVDPCLVAARPGQTLILRATVTGATTGPVDWVVPNEVDNVFNVQANGNRLTLISLVNVQGTFTVTARSQQNEAARGGAVISTKSAGFNPLLPPIVLAGSDSPNRDFVKTATAAGGDLYYVGYANYSAPGVSTPATNFFVKQFSQQTNALLDERTDQFTTFGIPVHVAADCAGNAYWFDDTCGDGCDALFKFPAPGGSPADPFDIPRTILPRYETLTVACNGALYFVATILATRTPHLFKVPVFGQQPIRVRVAAQPAYAENITSLAVDSQGRLLVGRAFGTTTLERLLVGPVVQNGISAAIDPGFTAGHGQGPVGDMAVDAADVVYVTTGLGTSGDAASAGSVGPLGSVTYTEILALNALGNVVYSIASYPRLCATGCTSADCNTTVPFVDIQSIAATGDGSLRVLDDVDSAAQDPLACQETVRMILLVPQ